MQAAIPTVRSFLGEMPGTCMTAFIFDTHDLWGGLEPQKYLAKVPGILMSKTSEVCESVLSIC